MKKNLVKVMVFLTFGICAGVAIASEGCPPTMLRTAAKSFATAEVVECFLVSAVVPISQGGAKQMVLLLNNNEDVTIAIFPTVLREGLAHATEIPLYVFTGLGVDVMEFDVDAKKTKLFIGDIDGDGLKEIGVLGLTQPNSLFTLKTYIKSKNQFSTYLFDATEVEPKPQSIVVAPDETLNISVRKQSLFSISGNEEQVVRRSFVVSKRLD